MGGFIGRAHFRGRRARAAASRRCLRRRDVAGRRGRRGSGPGRRGRPRATSRTTAAPKAREIAVSSGICIWVKANSGSESCGPCIGSALSSLVEPATSSTGEVSPMTRATPSSTAVTRPGRAVGQHHAAYGLPLRGAQGQRRLAKPVGHQPEHDLGRRDDDRDHADAQRQGRREPAALLAELEDQHGVDEQARHDGRDGAHRLDDGPHERGRAGRAPR